MISHELDSNSQYWEYRIQVFNLTPQHHIFINPKSISTHCFLFLDVLDIKELRNLVCTQTLNALNHPYIYVYGCDVHACLIHRNEPVFLDYCMHAVWGVLIKRYTASHHYCSTHHTLYTWSCCLYLWGEDMMNDIDKYVEET